MYRLATVFGLTAVPPSPQGLSVAPPKLENGVVIDDKSGHCCNNVRGKTLILPIYLFPDVSSLLIYCVNGITIEKDDPTWRNSVREVIVSARLNWKTLVDIRQLWYVLKDVDIEEINSCKNDSAKRLDILQDNLYLTDINQNRIDDLINKFIKDSYWNCFLLYDWFHNINWN